MRRTPFAALAAITTMGLTACTVSITDDQVFAPPQPGRDHAPLTVMNETALPADVTLSHGYIETPAGQIAYTHAARDAGDAARPVGIVCMGNAADRYEDAVDYIDDLIMHADIVTFDYPGYGDSDGAATVPTLESAIDAVVDGLTTIGVGDDQPVFAWGHSLGGFVCGQITGRTPRIDALALIATLPSTAEVAKAFTPRLAGPFVRYNIQDGLETYDTLTAIDEFDGPIMVLAPGNDDVFPIAQQRAFAEALVESGRDAVLVELPGAGHSSFDQHPEFAGAVADFVTRVREAAR